MLLSYNWLRELIDVDISYNELDNVLTMLGIELESAVFQSKKYENFIVAEVLEKEKHPDADKLSVCKVNTGNEILQVICGAPNVAKDQKVILGKSGAIVPNGGFKLEKRKIRGIESNGMICSLAELEMGEDTSGIHILPNDAIIGTSIADYFGMNDIILELGLTPNKPDCLSHIGIARELSAYLGKTIKYPDSKLAENNENINDYISVNIENSDKCPRYSARLVKNCKVGPSPAWLQRRLENIGLRPINVVVDVTNLVLMECGQPLHAFDYDKISGKSIIVKNAEEGFKFITLDSKERTLNSDMLVICDSQRPIAIGGVMGGQNSEITSESHNILIESAFFNPTTVRKTSKKLAIQSDSSYRFERGVDISNTTNALDRAAKLIVELTGGEIVGGKIDQYPNPQDKKKIKLRYNRVNKILGTELAKEKIDSILTSLLFEQIESTGEYSLFAVPYHRVDCDYEIDLIEEVARLYNYDNIENQYTSEINFSITDVSENFRVPKLRNKIRDWFVANGYNELLTQNQIDPRSAALFTDNPITIANPLGEDLSIMRPSMITSFLNIISKNLRNSNYNLKLFEIGKVFNYDNNADQFIKGIIEKENLTFAIIGSPYPKQWGMPRRDIDYYDIKGVLESLLNYIDLSNFKFDDNKELLNIFDIESQSMIHNNKNIGYFGLVNHKIALKYEIEHKVYIASLNLNEIYNQKQRPKKYKSISPFPRVYRDLAFIVDKKFTANELTAIVRKNAGNLCTNVILFDVFEGKSLESNQRSIAFNIEFTSPDKTLTDIEIESYINNIITNVAQKAGGILRK